jgi:L-fuculose-phosphate aldolase
MPPVIRTKDAYYERTATDMERHLAPPPWSLREKIALTCRILADEGHESAIAGQITARGDRPGTYWMLGFGLGFDEACKSNIVLVDDDLNLLEGVGMVNPSNRFHLWIYRHRPSVNAIVHTHPPHISALSMIGRPLVASHMDTSMFHEDCAYLPEWPGPPVGDEEGKIIHEALGDKRAILLAHHGQLVATATIEEACVLAVFIERAARLQLLAEAVAPIRPLDPALAREAHDYRLKARAVAATYHYFARRSLKRNADALD